MDTRRLILFFIFSFSLVMLWDAWQKDQAKRNAPPPVAAKAGAPAAQPAPGAVPTLTTNLPGAPGVPGATPTPAPTAVATPGATPAVPSQAKMQIKTDVLIAEIDAQGGDLRYLELTQHKDTLDKTKNFVLLEYQKTHTYIAQTGLIGAGLPTHQANFALPGGQAELKSGESSLQVRLEAPITINGVAAGKVAKIYTFTRGSYVIDVTYEVVNAGATAITPNVYLQVVRDAKPPAGDSKFLQTYTGAAFYTDANKFQKQDFGDIGKSKPVPTKTANDGWAGIIQHYFVAAWLPPDKSPREFFNSYTKKTPENRLADDLHAVGTLMSLGTIAPGATGTYKARLYAGPQDQNAMEKIAPGLELTVDYGWLTIIAQPMFWLVKWLFSMTGNWGFAIILLTVIVKAIFFPLSAASYKSMARMKHVTPKMTAIRERYGSDRAKMNQAMMELYKTEKINPLGGCLPIVVQIPVFIALYWVLLATVEMRHQPFIGWITDLTAQDPYYILPIIMAATMYFQTKMNPVPPDPVQAKVMQIMPFVFAIFFFFFPAGLVLYWVVNNILSIAQQWQITKMIESGQDPDKKKPEKKVDAK